MEKIKSFKVNHDLLRKGLYISRMDHNIITYDLRMKTPNGGDYLDNAGLHTIEHLVATYVRNSKFADDILYFGPMGCRTGFYLLVRDKVAPKDVIELVQDSMLYIIKFNGTIPGSTRIECGNYLNHDLAEAIREARLYHNIIFNWTPEMMSYPKSEEV